MIGIELDHDLEEVGLCEETTCIKVWKLAAQEHGVYNGSD